MNNDFVGSFNVANALGIPEPNFGDEVPSLLLSQVGSSGRSYRREGCTAARRIASDVFSPPRITKMIRDNRSRHMLPGHACDVTTVDPDDEPPWDSSRRPSVRRRDACFGSSARAC